MMMISHHFPSIGHQLVINWTFDDFNHPVIDDPLIQSSNHWMKTPPAGRIFGHAIVLLFGSIDFLEVPWVFSGRIEEEIVGISVGNQWEISWKSVGNQWEFIGEISGKSLSFGYDIVEESI